MFKLKDEIFNSFSFLEEANFHPDNKIEEDSNCLWFSNDRIEIRFTLYHQEIYIELARKDERSISENSDWIALTWLINFVSESKQYHTNYFRGEMDYEKKIRQQLAYQSQELQSNLVKIIDFFSDINYEKNLHDLELFVNTEMKSRGLI